MKGLHCLKYLLEENDFLCRIDLKDNLFLSATVHELKKVCEICLVGKSLRVSLPLFRIRACSQNVFKTFKGIHSSTETAEYSFSDGENIRGNFNQQRHTGFSSATSWFCRKSEKKKKTVLKSRALRTRNLETYFFVHQITCLHTRSCTSYFVYLK